MEKIAVVLFNLGGPDSKESIQPFLFNFFMDRNIVRLPLPFRFLLAKWISVTRSKGAALKSYSYLGYKSPLLENTNAQARELEKMLNEKGDAEYKVFVSMRYWRPQANETARNVKAWGPHKIILLPLYPQYSTTTTRSSFGAWRKAALSAGITAPESAICCYPAENGFIDASAQMAIEAYRQAFAETKIPPRLLFSAHGLPESIVLDGDPYQWQCEYSAQRIVNKMDIPGLDWAMCYQSRVGKQKWIGPSTEDELRRAAADKVPVVICPVAFTQDHVETLVEIEIEYRELAHKIGVPGFYRVPAVGTHPYFISGLAALVASGKGVTGIMSGAGKRICPGSFMRCSMPGR